MMSRTSGQSEEQIIAAASKALAGTVDAGASGNAIPSNSDVASALQAAKIREEVPLHKLSLTGQELTKNIDRLAEDTKRVFLDKNRDEDLQKAAWHASRAAQIARRHKLATSKEGEEALSEAREGMDAGISLAKLMVMSPQFRDQLADALGIVVESLRASPHEGEHKGITGSSSGGGIFGGGRDRGTTAGIGSTGGQLTSGPRGVTDNRAGGIGHIGTDSGPFSSDVGAGALRDSQDTTASRDGSNVSGSTANTTGGIAGDVSNSTNTTGGIASDGYYSSDLTGQQQQGGHTTTTTTTGGGGGGDQLYSSDLGRGVNSRDGFDSSRDQNQGIGGANRDGQYASELAGPGQGVSTGTGGSDYQSGNVGGKGGGVGLFGQAQDNAYADANEDADDEDTDDEWDYASEENEGVIDKFGTAITGRKPQGDYRPLPQETQDRISERFYKLMRALQSNGEYQRAMRTLIQKLGAVQSKGGIHAERVDQQLKETAAGRAFTEEAALAKDHALRLVESWVGGSLDPLFNSINSISDKLRMDDETRHALSGLGAFVERCLMDAAGRKSANDTNALDDEEAVKREAMERIEDVRRRLLQEYRRPIHRLRDELTYLMEEAKEDAAAQVLQRDVKDLVGTILFDEQGQPTVKIELIKDFEYIMSAFLRRVQYVPVPRVAMTTPEYDLAADNITLNIRELTPTQIRLETLTNVIDKDLDKQRQEKGIPQGKDSLEPIQLESFVRIHLTGITADLKNVEWYFNKKTGMVKGRDRGRADLKLYGKGLSVDIDVMPTVPVPTDDKPVAHSLEVLRAKASVHKLNLRVYDSSHDFMYGMFKPMIKGQLKKAIAQAVEEQMKTTLQKMDYDSTMAMMGQYPATKADVIVPPHQQGHQQGADHHTHGAQTARHHTHDHHEKNKTASGRDKQHDDGMSSGSGSGNHPHHTEGLHNRQHDDLMGSGTGNHPHGTQGTHNRQHDDQAGLLGSSALHPQGNAPASTAAHPDVTSRDAYGLGGGATTTGGSKGPTTTTTAVKTTEYPQGGNTTTGFSNKTTPGALNTDPEWPVVPE